MKPAMVIRVFLLLGCSGLALAAQAQPVAQPAPPGAAAPCELNIAPASIASQKTTLTDLPVYESEQVSAADRDLLDMSLSYTKYYYDPATGALFDTSQLLNVRDTAISAFVWAEAGQFDRALAAVEFVLANQDMDAASPQYGNFRVFAGDTEPTDQNWSAFIGGYLLVFVERYGQQLRPELLQPIYDSIRAAAQHRLCTRIPLQNTNITLLTAFDLIKAGELLDDPLLLDAGTTLWRSMVDFTLGSGIAEYNSPNYYKVDLYALGFIADYVRDGEIARQADQLRELLWCSIATRYHANTRQIAGPFSRTYTDRMAYEFDGMHPFLYRDSGGQIPYPVVDAPYVDSQLHAVLTLLVTPALPEACLNQALTPLTTPHQVRERTRIAIPSPDEVVQQITTYMHPRFAFGTVNTSTLLTAQARPLIAHVVDEQGGVGIFQQSSKVPSHGTLLVKSVQDNASALVALLVANPDFSDNQPVVTGLQWIGTALNPPSMDFDSVQFGDQLNSELMGIPISIRLAENLLPESLASGFSLERPNPETAELRLSLSPLTAPQEPLVTFPALVYGVYFGDPGAPTDALNPIVADGIESRQRARLTWESPDGVLELELPAYNEDQWYVDEWVDHVRVEPQPLAFPPLASR